MVSKKTLIIYQWPLYTIIPRFISYKKFTKNTSINYGFVWNKILFQMLMFWFNENSNFSQFQ